MTTYPNVKLNLGLDVLYRREDGFHELETLFIPFFGIRDELEIVPAEEFSITIEGDSVDWNPEEDLTARAYHLLKADFPLIPPVKIRLVKHSPVGAGLGGGSADAAFALRMISEISGLGLDDATLAGYAARLGSDCAFFVYNRPMLGRGRGEILEPFNLDLSPYEFRVEIPQGVSVRTSEAYRGVLASKCAAPCSLAEALDRPVEEWHNCLMNDFEATVFPLHPEIAALKQRFYQEGAVYAAMSGSGSAVFALFRK